MKRLLAAAAALWVAYWAAKEVVAYAGRHWRDYGPPPKNSPRPPGWMPGPFDR